LVQFFINSKPVPRAMARYRVAEANPSRSVAELSGVISKAVAGDREAVRFLSVYGVSIAVGG
jgi:hypothetical protein